MQNQLARTKWGVAHCHLIHILSLEAMPQPSHTLRGKGMDGAQVWQCHARHDALGALITTEAGVGKARDQRRNEDRLKGETPHSHCSQVQPSAAGNCGFCRISRPGHSSSTKNHTKNGALPLPSWQKQLRMSVVGGNWTDSHV